jgi:ABC-type uncharacterized transport system permease subunit
MNLSLEAMMLSGAYIAALASSMLGSPALGLLCGAFAGLLVGLLQANLSHRFLADQFVIGIVLNLLVLGTTSFLASSIEMEVRRAGTMEVPVLSDVPLLGSVLFAQRWSFYTLFLIVPSVWWLIYQSRWGLQIRAVGEDPAAAEANGIHVNQLRRQSIYVCSALAGLAGAHLSIAAIGLFQPNLTAGRGYIAIAAVIFGGWTVLGTILGGLIFGVGDALRLALPPLGIELNSQFLVAMPYLLALLALFFFARRSRSPSALGVSFRGSR